MADDSSRRPGRPPFAPERRRTMVLKVYVTEQECEDAMTLARRSRKEISEYMRHLLLQARARHLENAISSVSVPPR